MLARWRPCSTTSGELYRRYCANKKENAGRVANYLRTMGTIWRALSRPEIMMMGQIAYLDAYGVAPRQLGGLLQPPRAHQVHRQGMLSGGGQHPMDAGVG